MGNMVKATKKAKIENNPVDRVSKEALMEYVQDVSAKANIVGESRLHCAIAINQILSNAEYVELLNDEGKNILKEVWLKLKSEGIQLEDPPLLFGLPENFESDELAN